MKKNIQKKSSPDSSLSRSPTKQRDIKVHAVIDNVRSAYNIGSFFRTADATGCTKLHICGISAYPPNPKVEKTALGAAESVPWKYYKKTEEAIATLNKENIPIYAVELTENSRDFRTFDYSHPVAFIFGHELDGIGNSILKLANHVIHIPMHGKKSSLNVATVAGIILYEAIRNTS